MKELVTAFDVHSRLEAATEFIQRSPNQELLVIAATRAAADELVRQVCAEAGTIFGIHRFTLLQLAMQAATPRLVGSGKTVLAGVAVDALAARAVYECRRQNKLKRFESVARTPGFFRALASTVSELRINKVEPNRLAQVSLSGEDLANLLLESSKNLDHSGLADSASIYTAAIDAVRASEFPAGR